MNTADVSIYDPSGHITVPTYTWLTLAGNTALNPGEVVKLAGAATNNVVIVANGGGTTSDIIVGVVKSKDTVTSTATGSVDVYMPLPGIIYRSGVDTTTAFNTQAKINAKLGARVKFKVSSGAITCDTSQADSTSNGVRIVGGDPITNTALWMIMPNISFLGNLTT